MLCSLASAAVAGATRAHAKRAPAMPDHTNFMAGLRAGQIADPGKNGFDPSKLVRDFDAGRTRRLASGRVLREWELEATEKEIELAPGVTFPAWTYNDRVPGPAL